MKSPASSVPEVSSKSLSFAFLFLAVVERRLMSGAKVRKKQVECQFTRRLKGWTTAITQCLLQNIHTNMVQKTMPITVNQRLGRLE